MSATIGGFPSHVHRILISDGWLFFIRICRLTAENQLGLSQYWVVSEA